MSQDTSDTEFSNTLPRAERLRADSHISALISGGRWTSTAHLNCCWKRTRSEGPTRIMVSAPKKSFKRAVKRNLLKRRLREAFRVQKSLLKTEGVDVLFAYSSKEIAEYQVLYLEVRALLERISKALGV